MNREEKKELLEKTVLEHQAMLQNRLFHCQRGTVRAGRRTGNDRQGVFANRPASTAGIYPDMVSADLHQRSQRNMPQTDHTTSASGIAAGVSGVYSGYIADRIQRFVSGCDGLGTKAANGDHPALF